LLPEVFEHRFEIGQPCFGKVGACIGLGYCRFTPGYGSFRRNVLRTTFISEGGVNPVQLARLDGPLAQLISPCTDPARLDASQDRRFRHADSFRGLTEGVTHVLLSVPRTDPRNGAGGTVDGRLTARRQALLVGPLAGGL